ncbi:hypothetical protein BGX27_003070 [Mortierella sp. AM989]|nr:hypothetical protein BGX27_003070 [Mortierella sp. AM989]
MKRRRFSKSHGLFSVGLLLLLNTCYVAPSTNAAPTSVPSANHQQPVEGRFTSENIIRSIGFRECGSSPSLKPPTGSNSNAVRISNLALLYDEKTNKISLRVEGSTDHDFDATTAHVLLTAYDRVFYDQKINLGKNTPSILHIKGDFSLQETFSAPALLPEQLPKQLFSLPAVEALVSIKLYNDQGNPILCTSVPLTNTVSVHSPVITIASVSVTAAAIALTAISSILTSLTSAAVLTTIPLATTGSGAGGTGLSPSIWDVVSFCQFISVSGSLNVEYPELLRQWTQNFGWSMGLVHSESWSSAIDSLRRRTSRANSTNDSVGEGILFSQNIGNSPVDIATSGSDTNKTVTVSSMQSLVNDAVIAKIDGSRLMSSSEVFRSEAHRLNRRQVTAPDLTAALPVQLGAELLPSLQDSSLMNRFGELSDLKSLSSQPATSPTPLQPMLPTPWPQDSYHTSIIQPGLASFGERLQIPAKNMFMTSLFLFLILLLVTSVLALVIRISLEAYAYFHSGKFIKLRRRFSSYYIGNLLRVVLLAYFAVATMAFYQLTLEDSWAITLLAAMTLLLFLALAIYITLRLRRAGGTSLFFDERLKSKYGALYDQYILSAYWFFVPVLTYQIVKAAIVGLGNGSRATVNDTLDHHGSSVSWAQTSLLLLAEVCFAAVLIWKHPFAEKTPNRLNGVLACIRILNVLMLAILIEKTTVSAVSRAVVGVIIICSQALMMIVLACLIFYQLGKALWGLWQAVKSKNQHKHKKDNSNPLDSEEVLVISIKDNEKHDRDDEGPQGRMASELTRHSNESMTSLVGMMGIGSNPTIRCTPASDDEDDGFGIDNDDFEKDAIPDGHRAQIHHSPPPQQKCGGKTPETKECVQESIRDSAQSGESHSSLILDYYNPSYLPPSIRSKLRQDNREADKPGDKNGLASPTLNTLCQNTLEIPTIPTDEPWIQAAYMTRRRSESSVQNSRRQSSLAGSAMNRPRLSAQQRLVQEDVDEEALQQQIEQQCRRRPMSLGAARYSLEPMMFSMFATDRRRRDSRSARSSRIPEALPTFQSTFIPDSLLAGPPPSSSMQPRRPSIVSSASVNPLPQYSEISVQPSSGSSTPVDELIQPIYVGPITVATSMTASILNFEEYRFPDERSSQSSEGSLSAARRAAIIAAQRNIHPLSPFHPDFQHPDDIYNGAMHSPNEDGPTAVSGNARMSPTRVNIPNILQDGKDSRRESRVATNHLPTTYKPYNLIPHLKRPTPGLRIITNPKKLNRPPQIPIPALPMDPPSTSMTAEAITAAIELSSSYSSVSISPSPASLLAKTEPKTATARSTEVVVAPNPKERQQLTPVSSINPGSSKEDHIHTLGQEPNSHAGQQRRSLSNVVECFLAASPPSGDSSPNRQRAMSITPVTAPNKRLTVSNAHGEGRAAL